MLTSKVCCYALIFLRTGISAGQRHIRLEVAIRDSEPEKRNTHRKAWEWCAIAEALQETLHATPGRVGPEWASRWELNRWHRHSLRRACRFWGPTLDPIRRAGPIRTSMPPRSKHFTMRNLSAAAEICPRQCTSGSNLRI